MRFLGILLVLTGLGAIAFKVLTVYTGFDVTQYYAMVIALPHTVTVQSQALVAQYGAYADYGIRGTVALLGVLLLLLSPTRRYSEN